MIPQFRRTQDMERAITFPKSQRGKKRKKKARKGQSNAAGPETLTPQGQECSSVVKSMPSTLQACAQFSTAKIKVTNENFYKSGGEG